MARSFGKVVGIAARVKKGQVVFEAKVNKQHVADAKFALDLARKKLPCGFRIIVDDKTAIPKAVKAE
jgi:large subunit ribosomal protein L10e